MKFRETKKYNDWVKHFTDDNNKITYGNATQSALKAYSYNPDTQYHLASVTGSKNMRKYEVLASSYLDEMGFSFGELMKIGIQKMNNGSYDDWEAFMERLGYFDNKKVLQKDGQMNQFIENIGEAIARSREERGLSI